MQPDVGFIEVVQSTGVIGLLLIIVSAFLREWVVVGSVYRRELAEEKKEKEAWRGIALQALPLGEKAVEALKGSR